MKRRVFTLGTLALTLFGNRAFASNVLQTNHISALEKLGRVFLAAADPNDARKIWDLSAQLETDATLHSKAAKISTEHRQGATIILAGYTFSETEVALMVSATQQNKYRQREFN